METLDRHFRTLAGASFAKRGRAAGELLQHWPAIVGERLAEISEPERIRWPKGEDQAGGTLILRSAAGRALDLQHETERIIERINTFLGYGAVSTLKIVQSHRGFKSGRPADAPSLSRGEAEALDRKLATIADERLKEALKRLGTGALARGRVSPQAK